MPAVKLSALAAALACAACDGTPVEPALFSLVPPQASGVTFVNDLPEDSTFNILNYLYYYNGGGVAAGDIDNDGLADLYFTSNIGTDRLYRNKGNYRFEDITERAGVGAQEGWTSGVTMADVNGDGHLDIYVSGVSYRAMRGRNVLYVNDGDATFTDRTAEYGLEHVGYSTQATFFDYDADGDLDMYLLNSSVHSERGASARPQRDIPHPRAGDRLFRNDGNRFTDVSRKAGIYSGVEGYGLGVVASDLNLDGCIDLYVANDFQENDFLYYNRCDGTFSESIGRGTGHTSRFSMGVDAADVNNDGRPDIAVADMLPEREDILKTSANAESVELFELRLKAGYHAQYARNTLQLNRGGGRFSDVGYLAGVFATDWSWAPLFADLDNDGRKDLFITNGIYRRPNDLDYISHVSTAGVQATLGEKITTANLALLQRMPQVPLPNYAYRNDGDLRFTNMAEQWGLAQPGFSNGAVYVDLTNSGALDLVVSNVNAPASIYRNRAREINGHHYVQLRLDGEARNRAGIGARVLLWAGGMMQMLEQMPTRGFQSSVEARLHFGLGRASSVDSLIVIWPDRRFQVLTRLPVDRSIVLSQRDAAGSYRPPAAPSPLFADETRRAGVDFVHRENNFPDFHREPLIPHQLSTEGPALAVGDVNGDGLDDIFIGGAKWQPAVLFVQLRDGRFRASPQAAFVTDSLHEDVDAAFFDADNDGDQDLYVVSGGNEFTGDDEALLDRLYRNDGRGNFRRDREALPRFYHNGSCVAVGDFNADGHPDLFVGSRAVPGRYGMTPRSYLLQNDGNGRFADVTSTMAPGLADAGMVTSAAWLDQTGDGRLNLIVVGEWMPVRFFRLELGRLRDRTAESGLAATTGWWNSVQVADLNGDGRQDLVLGNLGLNSYIKASREQPARLYVRDFDRNGTLEQILTTYKNGVSYPVAGRDDIIRAIPSLRGRYPSYASFGASRAEEIFLSGELRAASMREARTFATSVAMDDGDGSFRLQALPAEAQFAPVYTSLVDDFDGDGGADILLGGNFFGVPPWRGRYDASYGTLLRGVGGGRFGAIDIGESGLVIEGQVRDIKSFRSADGGRSLAVARNNATLQILRLNKPRAEGGPK